MVGFYFLFGLFGFSTVVWAGVGWLGMVYYGLLAQA
jgi:hypothetical protein